MIDILIDVIKNDLRVADAYYEMSLLDINSRDCRIKTIKLYMCVDFRSAETEGRIHLSQRYLSISRLHAPIIKFSYSSDYPNDPDSPRENYVEDLYIGLRY